MDMFGILLTDEVIPVHGMKAQDIKDLLPPALQAQLFSVEKWQEISQGESPRIIPAGQRKNSGELPILPGESRRIVVSPLAQQEVSLPPGNHVTGMSLGTLDNKQVVANSGNNLDQTTTTPPDTSNQRRTRRRSSATNGVEE